MPSDSNICAMFYAKSVPKLLAYPLKF